MIVSMIVVLGATCPLRTGMAGRSTTSTTCLLTHSLTAQHYASRRSHSGAQLPAGVATTGGRALGSEQPRCDVTPLHEANSPPPPVRSSSRLILSQLSPLPVSYISHPRLRPSSSNKTAILMVPHPCYMPCTSYPPSCDHPNNT
jgi:hypothetical protein